MLNKVTRGSPVYTCYSELEVGEMFEAFNEIFMKMNKSGFDGQAAINLRNGHQHSFKDDSLVERISSVTIEKHFKF